MFETQKEANAVLDRIRSRRPELPVDRDTVRA